MYKFLANENMPLASIRYLQSKGWDIKSIVIECPGISDRAVMELAQQENRCILTFDRDYGELIFRHHFKPARGVIFLRISSFDPMESGYLLEQLLTSNQITLENSLTVLDGMGIRQRKY
jgi:predicted nuclease of predicted toxin-antitoxin system